MSKLAAKRKEYELEQAVTYLKKVTDAVTKLRTFDRLMKEYQKLKSNFGSDPTNEAKMIVLKTKMQQHSRIDTPGPTILLKLDDKDSVIQGYISKIMELQVAAFKNVVNLKNACPNLNLSTATKSKAPAPKISIPFAPAPVPHTTRPHGPHGPHGFPPRPTTGPGAGPALRPIPGSAPGDVDKAKVFRTGNVPLVVSMTPQMRKELETKDIARTEDVVVATSAAGKGKGKTKVKTKETTFKIASSEKICKESVKNCILTVFKEENVDKDDYMLELMRKVQTPTTERIKKILSNSVEKILATHGIPLHQTNQYVFGALESIMKDAIGVHTRKILLEAGVSDSLHDSVVEFIYEAKRLEILNILNNVELVPNPRSEADVTTSVIKSSRRNRPLFSLMARRGSSPGETKHYREDFL